MEVIPEPRVPLVPPLSPPVRSDETYSKADRLLKRVQFLDVQRRGARQSGTHLVVYAAPNEADRARLGITTSRKVGNSPARNLWRRRLREVFRRHRGQLPGGLDFVVIVRPGAPQATFEQVCAEFLGLAARAARNLRRSKGT